MSKNGGRNIQLFIVIFDVKLGGLKLQAYFFALYLFHFKRFSWSRELMKNGGSNVINKSSKLKPWTSNVKLFEICIDLGKVVFLCSSFCKKAGQHHKKIKFWTVWGGMMGPRS